MGIYDRDYYRSDSSGFMAFANRGAVCKWLIAINVAAFVLQQVTRPGPAAPNAGEPGLFTELFALQRSLVMEGRVWRLLTYAFLHDPGNLWHILFNMLFLWWFGADMEDLLGPREFLAYYLVAAVLGGLGFMFAGLVGSAGRHLHKAVGSCDGGAGVMRLLLS